MNSNNPTRRTFIGGASATAAGLGTFTSVQAQGGGANDKLVVAVMGMGRGGALAKSFHGLPNVEVAMVCDVDKKRSDSAAGNLGPKVESVTDFRRILDRREIDILVIATCNHWHAPAAVLGCEAGKHIYVEKPCSHNPYEGELLVQASRKYKRLMQHGTQRRSWPKIVEGIRRLREE
ncbi:MAG: Gfo/Idh/MocA family oxidoreductase, partial [Roseibacillus sp.]|nr:Gfo/Idh/MocA family oxidoreductase [Roseibacillus sp.]